MAPNNEFNKESLDSVSECNPIIVGVNDWSMCKHSIRRLMGPYSSVYYVLNVYHKMDMFDFGFASLPPKELFWQLAEVDTPIRGSENVLVHKWDADDVEFWQNLTLDVGTSLVISLELMPENESLIKVMFSHGYKHSAYTFKLCPLTHDAYLMFFAPFLFFKSGQIKFLNSYNFLEEYVSRIQTHKLELKECMTCQKSMAAIVFEPCGHCLLCNRCSLQLVVKECPLCRCKFHSRHEYSLPTDRCLVCPSQFRCTQMECLLLPCRCVIGCMRYAQLAIRPDEDSCPACKRPVEELLKVYFQ